MILKNETAKFFLFYICYFSDVWSLRQLAVFLAQPNKHCGANLGTS